LKAGEDIGVAIQHNDDWYWLDVEDPANLKYVQAPDGWLPRPKSPEEAERLASEAEAWASEPQREIQRELAALVAHRDSIQARIAALDAEEQAEQRRAEQRAADDRDHEAEQERLRQVRSLLPGGDA
jgi:hypothetical protein